VLQGCEFIENVETLFNCVTQDILHSAPDKKEWNGTLMRKE
jgi:hypothetical protein